MGNHRQYQLGTEENIAFLQREAQNLLRFARRFPSPGGGSYWLGDDGTPWTDRNRETWITCRMVHCYSMGALMGFPGSEALADAGLKGLTGELRDVQYGGWYAAVTPDGTGTGPKQCYAHAFVILAASSALLADRPGAATLLEEAMAVYDRYFWDAEQGLACDTWNLEFTKLDPYRGINANMHSVEAFLAVADVTGDESWRVRAGRIINHVISWASDNAWRIPEHFGSDWSVDLECNADKKDDQFKPYGATPGHGIEWARLITQWALSTYGGISARSESPGPDGNAREGASGNTEGNCAAGNVQANAQGRENAGSAACLQAAEQLYRRAVTDGWNADGAEGIVYTTDWNGVPVVHDRMQWPLAEAINTASVLYQVTGKQEYADDYERFLRYLDETVIDHVNGSWFHQLDADNHLLSTVWPGKSDIYHALQSMLIPRCPADTSVAKAVKEGHISL